MPYQCLTTGLNDIETDCWPADYDTCSPETDMCGPDYDTDCMPECGPEDGSDDPYP